MKNNLNKTLIAFGSIGLAIATSLLPLAHPVMAETVGRAQGRCKLTSGGSTDFDGYCVTKQKQQGSTTVFVIELDNGSQYRFFGANRQALQVETADGIHNVQFTDNPNSGVFTWQEDGDTNRLSVKLDAQYDPDVSHDDPAPSLGTALGAAIGTALVNAITGKKPAQQPSTASASQPAPDSPVPGLSDLVGARAGQAEGAITQRGYRYIKSSPGGDIAYYLEGRTNYCVAIEVNDGRFQSIAYTGGPANCQR